MATFAKPENALKRAEELINVGQKQAALQALHDLITSKRYRAWQKTLERIMFKYVELCVDMRRGRFAKDGLIQYRIVCQQVNVNSLEEVIKYFMQLSTEKAEQARSQAQALEDALDVDDLEAEKRPEDLMLSYVSGEKGRGRSDRELVTPWFKFLWETYRTVLEILRNNSKLEALYAMTAHRAFQFCKQYKRKTEFRRLCEIIRNHLANLNKYRDQRDRPDLSSPESLQLYLDTRFEQLKIATELELWQEAFHSVEDIHGLMCLVKKTPKPSLMAVYYAKLTEIFWVSGSHLYHAYAWFKFYVLQKSYNKNLIQKDLQLIASSVLLAALLVTPYDHKHGATHLELENEKEHSLRMASLLGFTLDPKRDTRDVLSRSALLSELASKGVIACVPQEVKDLYHLLEHEFFPLNLASKVQPLLSKLSKLGDKLSASPVPEVQLSKYVPSLEKLATLRLLQQVSQVYQTINIDALSKMIPFFDFSDVEKISVDAVRYNFVAMKVDHLKGAVIFGSMDLDSDRLCNHLAVLAESLNKARSLIYPPKKKVSKISDTLPGLAEIVDREHKRLLARKSIIEKRKEEQEKQMLEMEREEESKRLKLQKISEEAEQKRLASEYSRREEQRIRREIEERELEEAQALLEEAERRKGKKGRKPVIEGDKVTKQTLIELALSEQLKERQEMEKKLQRLAKTMDHQERAKREEEAPLIMEAYQRHLKEEENFHERQQLQAIEQSRLNHDGELKEKSRLEKMWDMKMWDNRILLDKVTKQTLIELALSEQLKERQEMEKKLQRLAKTMDHQERAKREEEAPLIMEAYQRHLKEEENFHERQQLQAIEQSRLNHDGELKEKSRLEKMWDMKTIFQDRVVSCSKAKAKEDKLAADKKERETNRKKIYYLREEEARLAKLKEEEEAQKREEAERQRKEAEYRAKLDEIAEKQRQRERELEEKERLRKEALLGRSAEPLAKAQEPSHGLRVPEPAAGSSSGKYVPKFRREKMAESSGAAPPPESDRWGSRSNDRPPTDRWRGGDERRPMLSGSSSRLSSSTWSSSRGAPHGGFDR